MTRPTVAACVMVRNEARTIVRCLESVRPFVDSVVIVDTGSTDDTLAIVRDMTLGVPAHVINRPWANFGHNRTESVQLAGRHGDYVLIVDADMTVSGELPPLTADGYRVRMRSGTLEFSNTFLVKSSAPWKFVGVTHEYMVCDRPDAVVGDAPGLVLTEHADGSRRQGGRKFREDVRLLERQIAEHGPDPRSVFYLARSYEDLATVAADAAEAVRCRTRATDVYLWRARLDAGYQDERFYSLFRAGVLLSDNGDGLQHLLAAWQMRPHRWEPVHAACQWLRQQQSYQASYALSRQAIATSSGDVPAGLFVHRDVRDWGLLFEHSISSHYVGEFAVSLWACDELLKREATPLHIREAVCRNRVFPVAALEKSRKGA